MQPPAAIARSVQELSALGQDQLLRTEYLAAERTLAEAAASAWAAEEWDALARLYMPLQEARRQRRQWSGDGAFVTDILQRAGDPPIDAAAIADRYPRGQLIVAGHASVFPALALRQIAAERGLYLDVPLAATYTIGGGLAVLFVPTADVELPHEGVDSIDELLQLSPPHSILLSAHQLPPTQSHGDARSFDYVMDLWESLHRPFLAAAQATTDPRQRLIGFARTIEVDYACELAHQQFSQTCRELSRTKPV